MPVEGWSRCTLWLAVLTPRRRKNPLSLLIADAAEKPYVTPRVTTSLPVAVLDLPFADQASYLSPHGITAEHEHEHQADEAGDPDRVARK